MNIRRKWRLKKEEYYMGYGRKVFEYRGIWGNFAIVSEFPSISYWSTYARNGEILAGGTCRTVESAMAESERWLCEH